MTLRCIARKSSCFLKTKKRINKIINITRIPIPIAKPVMNFKPSTSIKCPITKLHTNMTDANIVIVNNTEMYQPKKVFRMTPITPAKSGVILEDYLQHVE